MAKVKICETILRDAHQSQAATRMRLEEMLPIAEKLDQMGYYSLECWGGATFDVCLNNLNEDPWERLRALRKAMPNTKLQMLLRGQNLLGYKNYADDVVDAFVAKSVEAGIDIIRIFDALNDTRNMQRSIAACKKAGAHCQIALSYTTSPVHTTEYFVNLSKELEAMGADSICIKDMANLLLPYTAYDLVSKLKANIKIPIDLHTHDTTGTGCMVVLKAIEAGVDIVDTALSPLGGGTAQPATESLVATLQGTEYDTGLDIDKLTEVADYFTKVRDRLAADKHLSPKARDIEIRGLLYQVPGGMLSNLYKQLKDEFKAADRYYEVLAEVPAVRKDFGYPPLVTPTSQIVGNQAVLNVIAGERYKLVTKESKALLSGKYGKLPMEPNPDVVKKVIGNDEIITCRPADLLQPELNNIPDDVKPFIRDEYDLLSYIMQPMHSLVYFKYREAKDHKVDMATGDVSKGILPL